MSDNDGITDDIRSREEEVLPPQGSRAGRTAAADGRSRRGPARAWKRSSGIHDAAALQELAALGFTPETVSLLPMVPIIQMAWAEGGVSDEERALIPSSRASAASSGSVADQQLSLWLRERPGEDVFARATRLIRAMLDHPDGQARRSGWRI